MWRQRRRQWDGFLVRKISSEFERMTSAYAGSEATYAIVIGTIRSVPRRNDPCMYDVGYLNSGALLDYYVKSAKLHNCWRFIAKGHQYNSFGI